MSSPAVFQLCEHRIRNIFIIPLRQMNSVTTWYWPDESLIIISLIGAVPGKMAGFMTLVALTGVLLARVRLVTVFRDVALALTPGKKITILYFVIVHSFLWSGHSQQCILNCHLRNSHMGFNIYNQSQKRHGSVILIDKVNCIWQFFHYMSFGWLLQ
jgi:hypothetical protein